MAMAKRRKRTYRRKNPVSSIVNPVRVGYRRRNPVSFNLSGLDSVMYQTLGFVGFDYVTDLIGMNRYVGSGENYSHNWLRNMLGIVGGILLKDRKGFVGKIGEGILIRGLTGLASSFVEDKEITNTVAKALANSNKENIKNLVGPSALGGLGGNGTGLGDYLQLDDGSIINTTTGEVISQPATQINYSSVSGFNGANYFELK